MGIDTHGLNCLRFAHRHGGLGKTATLGRQSINLPAKTLTRELGDKVSWRDTSYCEPMLTAYFGASSVESYDNSDYEKATHIHDFNHPLPTSAGEFDTVIDFGTTEHVFNVATALRNVVRLCRVGGQVLHVVPANNFCGHGFWQLSPELFFSLYSPRNGFGDTEVFVTSRKQPRSWYRVAPPHSGYRVPLATWGKTYVICRSVRRAKVENLVVQQSDYLAAWGAEAEKTPDPGQRSKFQDWFYRRVQYKYFRGLSQLNPHLTKVDVRTLWS
jgi:SAM-dependent methyltransferase